MQGSIQSTGNSLFVDFVDEGEYLQLTRFVLSGFVSWAFHPVILTPLSIGLVITLSQPQGWILGLTSYIMFGVLVPLSFMAYMKFSGQVSDWNASKQNERPKLLFAVAFGGLCSVTALLIAKSLGFKSPNIFSIISLSQALAGLGMFLTTVLFIKRGTLLKPSFHVGGTCFALSIIVLGGLIPNLSHGIMMIICSSMLMAFARVNNRHHHLYDTVISFLICGASALISSLIV